MSNTAKSCKAGYYYCFTDKKCKKIPLGFYVGRGGYLSREDDGDDSKKNGKNGNGNGNGDSGNGNGGSNGGGNGGGGNGGGGGGSVGESLDASKIKKMIKNLKKSSKMHKSQADQLETMVDEESNPRIPRKKGQPAKSKKHSDLYTDENPVGTIHGLGFKDEATAKSSVAKIKKSDRSHAHKIQAAVAMEQRAREMGKTSAAAVYRKFINSMKNKTEKMNESSIDEKWSSKYKKSIDCNNPKGFSQKAHCQGKKKMNEEKHDHEHEMIRRQMDTVTSAAKRLKKKVGNKGEGNVKAWVQSKITKAADYIDTAADYMDSDVKEENIDEAGKKCWKGYKKAGTQKLFGKTYNRCVKKEETCPTCNEEPCKCEGNLEEGNKSGDTSLRDWFSKSRSSDGTPGWVQLGGKYAGKPCARQPGQKTKPKCGSSKMKRNLNDKEEEKAFRRKNREDGNPNRKGKAKNVATEEAVLENQSAIDRRNQEIQRKQIQLDRQKIAVKRKMSQMDQKPTPNDELSLKVRESAEMRYCPKCQKNETRDECVFGPKYWDTYSKPAIKEEEKKKKRDACYHKVKSRYSVWPSAYASGALVKCRKVGAKNWGNSKKEEVEFERVVEFLYVEGFAKSVDDAAEMAINLSESWVNEILNG